jgi:hypothetical protein
MTISFFKEGRRRIRRVKVALNTYQGRASFQKYYPHAICGLEPLY